MTRNLVICLRYRPMRATDRRRHIFDRGGYAAMLASSQRGIIKYGRWGRKIDSAGCMPNLYMK